MQQLSGKSIHRYSVKARTKDNDSASESMKITFVWSYTPVRWTLSKCHEGRWEPRFVWTQDCSMKINGFVRVQQHYLYFLFDLFFVWLQIPWEKFTREPKHGSLTKVVHEKLVIPALQLAGWYLGVSLTSTPKTQECPILMTCIGDSYSKCGIRWSSLWSCTVERVHSCLQLTFGFYLGASTR